MINPLCYIPKSYHLLNKNKIIEVAGYAGDRYWQALPKKIRLLRENDPDLDVYIITSYYAILWKCLGGDSKVITFKWKELEKMLQKCRE